MQNKGSSKPVSFKCFNCNHQEIAWKDETGIFTSTPFRYSRLKTATDAK